MGLEVRGLRIYLQSSALSHGLEKFTHLITEGAMQQSGFRRRNETPAETENKGKASEKNDSCGQNERVMGKRAKSFASLNT